MDEEQRSLGSVEDMAGDAGVSGAPPTPGESTRPLTLPAAGPVAARRSSARWAIALLVVALVVAVAGGAFFILAGGSETFTTAGWAPAESVAYGVIRTDLPGDQRQNVASLLAPFPGFADQSTFDQKLDEALDRLIKAGTDGRSDYTTTFKPWLGGEIGFALTRLPNLSSLAALEQGGAAASPGPELKVLGEQGGGLVIITVKDPAGAEAWFRTTIGGAPSSTESYAGATITLYRATDGTVAEAASAGVMLVGDEASVKAGLDAKAKGGLAGTADFRAARSAVAGDRLGWVYVAFRQYVAAALAAVPSAAPSIDQAKLPGWMAFGLRAESDRLVADGAMPAVAGTPAASDQVSALAPRLPGTTVLAVEAHGIGAFLKTALDGLRAQPGEKAAAGQVDDALGRLGGFDSLLGWMGDGALVVTYQGGSWGGGLVVKAPDAATADAKLVQLKNLLALASLGGTSVATREESYAGTTITVADLGDLSSLAAGLGGGSSGVSPTPPPSGERAELAFAQRDGLVVVGLDTFVKAVLDAKAGSSLADQPRYRAALERAGSANMLQAYVDVADLVGNAERSMSESQRATYEADTRPYLEHLQAWAMVGRAGDPTRFRAVLTVK